MADALREFISVHGMAPEAKVPTNLVTLIFYTFDHFCVTNDKAFLSSRNVVFCGRHHDAERVLKVTLPEYSEAFENEIDVLHVLSFGTDAVPPVHDIWRLADGTCGFTMPMYHITLLDVILAGTCTLQLAWNVVRTIETVYAFAHEHGISHCDLKAENVYLDDYGHVIVGDWDLACDNNQQNVEHIIVGTAAYNPPSEFGISLTSIAADTFRVGSLMYTMMYGTTPLWEGLVLRYYTDATCSFQDDVYTTHMLTLLRQ